MLGKVFYAIRCTEAARRFTARLLDLLRITQYCNVTPIPCQAKLDALWIVRFLNTFNGKTMMKPHTAERVCFVDTCPQGGGCSSKGHGFYMLQFPEYITKFNFCIAALEAFNLLLAVRLWAGEWSGLKVLIFCDNWSVVCAVNSGIAQESLLRGIIRELWWWCASNDIHLVVRHRPGANMEAADMLSRVTTTPAFEARLASFKAQFNEPERCLTPDLLTPPIRI